jgi:hypothetical protein
MTQEVNRCLTMVRIAARRKGERDRSSRERPGSTHVLTVTRSLVHEPDEARTA